jgi:carboxylesterase type B
MILVSVHHITSCSGEIHAADDEVWCTYWTNFAKTGNPNGGELPKWPVYDPKKGEIIEFQLDGSAVGKPDSRKARLVIGRP